MEHFMKRKEAAEGTYDPSLWAAAVVKVACLLIIGLFIINGIVVGANITANSMMYTTYSNVIQNFNSGYTLAALMVLVVGASAIMSFLGFM